MSFFGRLFGKRARTSAAEPATARHRAGGSAPVEEAVGGPGERPLFRDQAIGAGDPPQARPTVCTRCGSHHPETSRFCSQCGAPLRGGQPYQPQHAAFEGSSETTSTISISGIEAYESEITGQTPLPTLSPEAQAAVDALPPGSALLVVRRGPNAGSRFLLDADLTTAGRHPESDIFLDDVTVSRRHVEFRRGPDGGFHVADVGSLNGTYVNREPIDSWPLSNGDEVQIGKYRLIFHASQRIY